MARTIATTTIAANVSKVTIRRTRRTCIEATPDGHYQLIAEREEVELVNGTMIGAPRPCANVVLDHASLVANPSFAAVQSAISAAIDAKDAADEAARAQAASESIAQENS